MFPHTFVELVHESIVSGHNCNEILTILYSSYLKKKKRATPQLYYSDVIINAMASLITGVSIAY